MKGGWSYRRAGNRVGSGANKRHGLDAVRLRSFACLRETGAPGDSQEPTVRNWRLCIAVCALQFEAHGAGIYQILASRRNQREWPVPLSRAGHFVDRGGRFIGVH